MNSESLSIRVRQKVRWLPADMDTPISLFLGMARGKHGILLESAEVDGRWGRYSVLACDMAVYLSCRKGLLHCSVEDERFASLRQLSGMPFMAGLREAMRCITIEPDEETSPLPPITRSLCGYFGYGMAGLFDPELADVLPPEDAECVLCLPGTLMLFDHLYNRLAQVSLGEHREVFSAHSSLYEECEDHGSDSAEVAASFDEEGYGAIVEHIRRELNNGEAIHVVPSVGFSAPFCGDPLSLYRRMRSSNASPYMFFMRLPEMTLFGSSPEVLIQCTAGRLLTAPVAGKRLKRMAMAEDDVLAEELLADPRERAEHIMMVDLGRSDLGRIARMGTVKVERLMKVERFSHVIHLTSRITAELKDGLDAVDVLSAVFPAGSVCGAPKPRAMEFIAEFEKYPRGPYGGCIGWLGLDKDSVHLDTGITVRSMWVRDGRLHWQVGGSIAHDSDTAVEWKEICGKSAIMRQVCCDTGEHHVSAHR
ncbi:MAG: anthranilate synthase component I family protein [Mailhella sp.]|nr:anthranilate synthase component I family protein [Mailhella sp.]